MKRTAVAVLVLLFALPVWGSDKLGIGDAVRVTVFQQPDLTTEARISENGTIALPLIGEAKVAGATANEAAAKIAAELKKGKFLKNPQVSVARTTLRSEFGSTACKSMLFCDDCRQPFEAFKAI